MSLIVLSPIFLLTAIGILISDWGPIFYKANRIGKGNKPFKMYKFRSMKVLKAPKKGSEASLRPDEDRIFPFGHFIRKAKIDELPQLINILNGTMSIVGPRPVAEDQFDMFRYGKWNEAAKVPVGLSGPAALYDYIYGDQITDEKEYMEKVYPTRRELEYTYVQKAGLWYDFNMIIQRNSYLNKLISRKQNGLIKVVTGVRRCGKSFLLFNLFHNHLVSSGVDENHIIEVALDDRSNKHLRDPDNMLSFVKEKIRDNAVYYIILDEIQMLDEFEDVLNSFLHIRNADVYVTGSNSRFLSSDVITEFRGRGDEIRVHPLSFREYVSVYQGTVDEAWEEYYTYGGLPLILTRNDDEEKSEYLISLFQKVYLTDIVDRHLTHKSSETVKYVQEHEEQGYK